jgi:hypothetical protein
MFFALKNQGVSGIGSTLKAGHNIVRLAKHINNFTFTFIAPLEA